MALSNYEDQGSDERTARLARVYDQEMDAPGEETIASVLQFRELDERTDGAHIVRMLWDSASEVLPIVIEVFEVGGSMELPIHRLRVVGEQAQDAFAHPFA